MIKLKDLLLSEAVYKRGMYDPKVGTKIGPIAQIQQKLIDAGFMDQIPDSDYGIYGPKTKSSVIKFQKDAFPDKPKEWDGIVGTDTQKILDKLDGKNILSKAGDKIMSKAKAYDSPDSIITDTKIIIDNLYKATAGIGTKNTLLRHTILQIKDKQTLDAINKILKDSQHLYHKLPPNSIVSLSNGSQVNTSWIKDYDSIEAILDGEYGWSDELVGNDKSLSLQYLDKLKGKKKSDMNLGPIAWMKRKLAPAGRAILMRIAPMLAQYWMPKDLTTTDFTKSQLNYLGSVIQRAIKRGTNVDKGAVSYNDYGNEIQKLLESKQRWDAKEWLSILKRLGTGKISGLDVGNALALSTLLGRFNYKKNISKTPEIEDSYMILPDTYDFSYGGQIKNKVTLDELIGRDFFESINYIMKKNPHLYDIGIKGLYSAIRHIGYLNNPQGGTRPNGRQLATINISGIELPTV